MSSRIPTVWRGNCDELGDSAHHGSNHGGLGASRAPGVGDSARPKAPEGGESAGRAREYP